MTTCQFLREHSGEGLALDAPEIQHHLATCPECRLVVDGMLLADRVLAGTAREPVAIPAFETIAAVAVKAAAGRRKAVRFRRRLPFFYTGLGAAAAAVLIIAGLWGTRSYLQRPSVLSLGTELLAKDRKMHAALPSGANLWVTRGKVQFVPSGENEERIVLVQGQASFDVPKLNRGRILTVRTPDADIRVHGTRFQVTRTGEDTIVQVTEGMVEVRPEGMGRPPAFLSSGQSLTVPSAAAYRASVRQAVLRALDRGEFSTAEEALATMVGQGASDAQMAEGKALFAWSLAAQGKRSLAIAAYREAMELLPKDTTSLWADNACAELAVLLDGEDTHAATRSWQEYLRRFPTGIHAHLARTRLEKGR